MSSVVAPSRQVFVTGATGHIGRALIPTLLGRGHHVTALARPGSEARASVGARIVVGDPLKAETFQAAMADCDTLVHLVGVSHPSPWKAESFENVDLASLKAALMAARSARIRHFIYLSVAQPAPIMKAYLRVRQEGERLLRESGIGATFVRPWYVLGPGRRWPMVILPLYWLFERFSATRGAARRLGFVTQEQMTKALVWAVEHPAAAPRVLDVPAIRHIH